MTASEQEGPTTRPTPLANALSPEDEAANALRKAAHPASESFEGGGWGAASTVAIETGQIMREHAPTTFGQTIGALLEVGGALRLGQLGLETTLISRAATHRLANENGPQEEPVTTLRTPRVNRVGRILNSIPAVDVGAAPVNAGMAAWAASELASGPIISGNTVWEAVVSAAFVAGGFLLGARRDHARKAELQFNSSMQRRGRA